jgi:hypothetical protein
MSKRFQKSISVFFIQIIDRVLCHVNKPPNLRQKCCYARNHRRGTCKAWDLYKHKLYCLVSSSKRYIKLVHSCDHCKNSEELMLDENLNRFYLDWPLKKIQEIPKFSTLVLKMANFPIAEISINLYSSAGIRHQFSLLVTNMLGTFPS